jgi:hypothetical protein
MKRDKFLEDLKNFERRVEEDRLFKIYQEEA